MFLGIDEKYETLSIYTPLYDKGIKETQNKPMDAFMKNMGLCLCICFNIYIWGPTFSWYVHVPFRPYISMNVVRSWYVRLNDWHVPHVPQCLMSAPIIYLLIQAVYLST